MPRVDLPQRRVDDRSRRARRDFFFTGPKSSNTFYMGDTEKQEQPDFQERLNQRSKSVSRPMDYEMNPSVHVHTSETQNNTTSSGRMYSRSCSRYRSTDIDVALATLSGGNTFNDDRKTKKMASSLFDLSARRQLSISNNLQLTNGKSNNSLLETDIDTGEQKNQQIILETDVDTLNTYRLVGDFAGTEQGPIQSNNDKTCSLFNLSYPNGGTGQQSQQYTVEENGHTSRADAYKRAQSLSGIAKSSDIQRTETKFGSSGLVARLRARARSNHELRVAESLTRIHVPEWLDKADLSRPISNTRRNPSPSPTREKTTFPHYGESLPSPLLQTPLMNGTSIRKTIETVSKPMFSLIPPSRTEIRRPLRPSQILRERNASSGPKLTPIKSSLRNSMKSNFNEGINGDTSADRGGVIRAAAPSTSFRPIHLNSEDFLTREEKVWGKKPNSQYPPVRVSRNDASAELILAPITPSVQPTSLSPVDSNNGPIGKPHQNNLSLRSELNGSAGTIKMADSESVIENQFYQPMKSDDDKAMYNRFSDEGIYEEVQRPTNFHPPPLSVPRASPSISLTSCTTISSNPHSPTWHNADSDGETETAATDGLDNISDLACLTDMLDMHSQRHLNLLQNRPSALENILTQFGWWSRAPDPASKQHLRGTGDYVALAAGHFNLEEDSHRNEFLTLLTGPAGQGPMILTEYGFDQKRIGLDRNPKDGMLYLHCNNPACPRMGPTRVDRARSWRTCTNCFTAYCSPKCREQALPMHNVVCSFGRVRLACGRILHRLAPSQQASLTALAKAGATRIGRGAILIAFASVQDAEFFLARSAELPLRQSRLKSEVASSNRPSPSGLVAPPIYLTVDELNKLDSKLATPCKLYKPSSSYVLIVIICAYDLEIAKNGRPVHLYKQCIILPFPMVSSPTSATTSALKKGQPAATRITKDEREAYSKRLQRTLRERGISLRNNEPEIYKRLSKFVETGELFDPVEFDFHDYYSNQMITCTIAPMEDVVIRQKLNFNSKILQDPYRLKANQKKKVQLLSRSRIGETEL